MLPKIDLIVQIGVQPCLLKALPENRFVCPRSARSNDDAVQIVLMDGFLDVFLPIVGTGEQQIH
jgi:hypothetical protein